MEMDTVLGAELRRSPRFRNSEPLRKGLRGSPGSSGGTNS
jgi:hypothetical protein